MAYQMHQGGGQCQALSLRHQRQFEGSEVHCFLLMFHTELGLV